MPKRGRRHTDPLLHMALSCGATVEKAAATAGVGEATVYRRLKDAEFQRELRTAKTEMVGRTASMLTAAGADRVR